MTIKTGGPNGRKAFQWCRDRAIIGLGWSCAYQGVAEIPPDPIAFLRDKYPQAIAPVRMILNRVQRGDLIWLHQQGMFFLCRVLDDVPLVGASIDEGFCEYDVGHARRAAWMKVEEEWVPGKIQRAIISPRMISQIPCSARLSDYCGLLHSSLQADPAWRPRQEIPTVVAALKSLSRAELQDFFSPDDWEDIIAAFLQTQGWVLIKSSCFRSKPTFEFRVIRERDGVVTTAYLQVKSGKEQQLRPADYAKHVRNDVTVFLYSDHSSDPYPGPSVDGVCSISYSTVHTWMLEHPALLPLTLRTQLCASFLCASNGTSSSPASL